MSKLPRVAGPTALTALSVVAFALLLSEFRGIGYALTAVVLAGIVVAATATTYAKTMPAQLLVTCGVLAEAQTRVFGAAAVPMVAAAVVIVTLVVSQPSIDGMLNRPRMSVSGLPGFTQDRWQAVPSWTLYAANLFLIALLAVCGARHATMWPMIVATALVALGVAVAAGREFRQRPRGTVEDRAFRTALLAYDPRFAVYFTAPDETDYHVEMWLPYLRRIGRPFLVIVREEPAFRSLSARGDVPIVFAPAVPFVGQAVTDGMRVCFYVNNGAKNTHMVRFTHMTHIQLLHGDSDKASSANPVTAMFDRIFVAGQAGIDRYAANGVHIPVEKFDIVGRPQAEAIAVASGPVPATPTVLYATTWTGLYTDANYCSLPIGTKIVAALLERGARVIFRPHPYTFKNPDSVRQAARVESLLAADAARTGRAHVYGTTATRTMSLVDCINAADALVSDVSSVASDWLHSDKPFALTNMAAPDNAGFVAAYPLAGAAYVLDPLAARIGEVLDALLADDPKAAVRRAAKTYYLGDFDTDNYADAFVTRARAYVDRTPIGRTAEPIPARGDDPAVVCWADAAHRT